MKRRPLPYAGSVRAVPSVSFDHSGNRRSVILMDPNVDSDATVRTRRHDRWRLTMDAVATAAMVATCILLLRPALSPPRQQGLGARAAPQGIPDQPVSLEGAATIGETTARVAIIQYTDFTCPFSAKFARETLPALRRGYIETGKVLLALRHLPLERIHPRAMRAAETVECAGMEGRFWQMHDYIFETPGSWAESAARVAGVDAARFGTCLDKGLTTVKIRRDVEGAGALRVTGTSTFLLGTIGKDGAVEVKGRISGAPPFATFAAAVEELLRRNSTR